MPEFPGVHHVALTVSDIDRSVSWYQALIGSDPVIDEGTGPFRHVVWLMGGTLLGLHHFHGDSAGSDFDEHRVGLDHVGFACADRAELESVADSADRDELHALVKKHYLYTDSAVAKRLMDDWDLALSQFVKVMPTDYKRVLAERAATAA